jgi:tetratricopeptide (TPR) repeat protein
MTEPDVQSLLQAAIAAARAGKNEEARDLFLQVIARDDQSETAWLWLSSVVDDPEEQQICLENVLTLNPGNRTARSGLRWLSGQQSGPDPASLPGSPAPATPPAREPHPATALAGEPSVEINPFGCPYCGGPVETDEGPRCLACGRLAAIRHRKEARGPWLGWLVLLFVMLGATAWMDGAMGIELVRGEQLPAFLDQTPASLVVGRALRDSEIPPESLNALADTLAVANYGLAALCLVAAVGLAFRSRLAYFGALLLTGLLVVATLAGLVAGIAGWLPVLVRLAFIALALRWLVDSTGAFEWEVDEYNAGLDIDLHTDLDYYNRGLRYRQVGMWAKAAAHWKVAGQLAPGNAAYHVALANAYLEMGRPDAALATANRAVARDPDDARLRAFREVLAWQGDDDARR